MKTGNFGFGTPKTVDTIVDVVYIGTTTLVAGKCYYLIGSVWTLADRRNLAGASSFLGIALASGSSGTVGCCIRGMATMAVGVGAVGDKAYLLINGDFDNSATSSSGEFVRLMGYVLSGGGGQIYFNPSMDWLEIA